MVGEAVGDMVGELDEQFAHVNWQRVAYSGTKHNIAAALQITVSRMFGTSQIAVGDCDGNDDDGDTVGGDTVVNDVDGDVVGDVVGENVRPLHSEQE